MVVRLSNVGLLAILRAVRFAHAFGLRHFGGLSTLASEPTRESFPRNTVFQELPLVGFDIA